MRASYTSMEQDYYNLRNAAGLIDYDGIGLFRVSGPGASAFLNEVCSRSTDFLLEGQVLTALALGEDGTVVAELLLHCDGGEYLVEVWPSQRDAAWSHLEKFAESRTDVRLDNVSDTFHVFGVEGPSSFKVVQGFLSLPVASMAYSSFTTETWRGERLLVSRTGVTGEYGYKLHVPEELAEDFHKALLDEGAANCGSDALDVCRMEMRFVNLEDEGADGISTPFDLGLQWMADFQHEFPGKQVLQEGLANIEHKPVCWVAEELQAPPERGTAVTASDGTVGHVAHSVFSPSLGHVIGTAQVDVKLAASGLVLQLADTTAAVRTVSAPFRIPASFGVPLE